MHSLNELHEMKSGLIDLNKTSAEMYAKTAADYVRAARLAGQVKTDLTDISRRIGYVDTTESPEMLHVFSGLSGWHVRCSLTTLQLSQCALPIIHRILKTKLAAVQRPADTDAAPS